MENTIWTNSSSKTSEILSNSSCECPWQMMTALDYIPLRHIYAQSNSHAWFPFKSENEFSSRLCLSVTPKLRDYFQFINWIIKYFPKLNARWSKIRLLLMSPWQNQSHLDNKIRRKSIRWWWWRDGSYNATRANECRVYFYFES